MRFVLESPASPASEALVDAFVADISERYPGWTPAASGAVRPGELVPPAGAWLIAYVDDEPVACGGVKRLDVSTAEIRRVFVHRDQRGTGIGRGLLEALTVEARRLGCRRVRLNTGDRQPEALGLFHAAGFQAVEPFNDNAFSAHWLELELG